MILATIAGGMTGIATALVLGAGLVAPASPGSIIAYTLVAPRGGLLPVYGSVLAATVVSFFVAAVLFGFGRGKDVADEVGLETAHDEVMEESGGTATASVMTATRSIAGKDVRTLIIACDAGMGSSVMVAGAMRKKLAAYGVTVTHSPVNEVPADAELIMSQSGLAQRVRSVAPHAVIVTFERFVGDPAFARIEAAIRLGETIE